MPVLTFPVDEERVAALLAEQLTPVKFLEKILLVGYQNDTGFDLGIKSSLLAFHRGDGGSPEVSKFRVLDCSFDLATQSGKVRLTYEVSFTYGCADIHRTDNFTETCKFQIDTKTQKLLLHITDQITRDTIDEF
jgi:hypothetical protein